MGLHPEIMEMTLPQVYVMRKANSTTFLTLCYASNLQKFFPQFSVIETYKVADLSQSSFKHYSRINLDNVDKRAKNLPKDQHIVLGYLENK